VSVSIVDRAAAGLERVFTRRSFINRAAMVGTAVAVGKGIELLVAPGTAYARVCGCGGRDCTCGSKCCTGYTAFCCTVNGGYNYCPSNTVMGGWWKADTSSFCGGGPRYYMDCNAICSCGSGSFCSGSCDTASCGCANGSCAEWRSGCVQFRYGQCNQDVAPLGRIVCRMVACVPPWEIDPTCTTASARDNSTAEHSAPCWQDVAPCESPSTRCQVVDIAATPSGRGYGQVTAYGRVLTFGDAVHVGDVGDQALTAPVVALAFSLSLLPGYWLAAADGGVFNFGSAPFLGSLGDHPLRHPIVGMAPTPSGHGYWLVAADGGIFTFGDALFYGSLGAVRLNQPIVGMAASASGAGYWLLASDGGVFTFGDATFHGSAAGLTTAPVVSIAPHEDSSGAGYWLVAADGGVFSFGSAVFAGAASDARRKVTGVAGDPDGTGYWVVADDGSVRAFGAVDHGSAS
jgi:hypothetical protein